MPGLGTDNEFPSFSVVLTTFFSFEPRSGDMAPTPPSWFALMAWPSPQGTIWRDTLGQLEQYLRYYYRLLFYWNCSNAFTVLPRLGSRFCNTEVQPTPPKSKSWINSWCFYQLSQLSLGGWYIHSKIGSLDDHRDTGVLYHILLSSDTTKIPKK